MLSINTINSMANPTPTGKYAIGSTNFYLIDDSRTERHQTDEPGKREWMVHAWYPADALNSASKTMYSDGMANRIKTRLSQFWNIPSDKLNYLDQLDRTPTHTLKDVPIYSQSKKFPVLFFSHGFGQSNFMYSSLIEEMASHGFIVFAIEHTYSNLATQFPDGRIVENTDLNNPNKSIAEMKELLNLEIETWVKDVQFTCDQLEKNSPIGDTFREHIDLDKIGIFGHSFGGATAVQVCRQDHRFKAGINLDGAIQGKDKTTDINKPFMFLLGKAFSREFKLSDEIQAQFKTNIEELQKTVDLFVEDIRELYQNLSQAGYYILLPEVDHGMFGDNIVLGNNIPETMKGKLDPNRAMEIIRSLIVDFFNCYLINKKSNLNNDLNKLPASEVKYESRFTM